MTTISSGSPLMASMQSTGLTIEAEQGTNLMKLAGSGDTAFFKIHEKPDHGRGENITHYFQSIVDDQDDHGAEAQVLGDEQSDDYLYDTFSIGYQGKSAGTTNVISEQQRVTFNLDASKRRRVAGSWAQRWEKCLLAQLTGDTVAAAHVSSRGCDFELTGKNDVTAQDAGHIIYAGDGNTSAADVVSDSSPFSLDLLAEARMRAASRNFAGQDYIFAPGDTPFGQLYLCTCSLSQWNQLITVATEGEITLLEKAKIEGGFDLTDNALVHGLGGIWLDTLILVTDFSPQAVESGSRVANTRVATFSGAGALDIGYGEGFTDGNHLGLSVERVHRKWSLLVDTVWGCKRRIPRTATGSTGQSWATFNIVTYSSY